MKESAAIHPTFRGTNNPGIIPASRKLNFLALVSVVFFTVCGGAFGIESLIGKVGAGFAVLLILATPLLWSLPISLMVSELSSAMPEEGGYYIWVRKALGNFWGFQEGWWTICYTAVDMAIYPVLFVNYLAFFFPSLQPDAEGNIAPEAFLIRWGCAVCMIFFALWLNWNGAKAVGYNSTFFLLLILLPFMLLGWLGLSSGPGGFVSSWEAIKDGFSGNLSFGLIAAGLATVMWNYSGWDNVSTFAEEVNNAPKNYPRALFAALGLATCVYLIPVFALIGHTTSSEDWNESAGFPVMAERIGGFGFGFLIAAAALVSAWSLFNSQLLYASRLPFAMANDGWLPKIFAKTGRKTGVPTNTLIACCLLASLFSALPFGKLVVIDIIFYSAELLLEFIALIVLRRNAPDMPRPFKIRGGMPVLILLTILPMSFAATVIWATLSGPETDLRHLWIVAIGLLSGIALYFLRKNHIAKNQGSLVSGT